MTQRTTSKTAPSQIKPAALRIFHEGLAAWYATHGRHHLPWRQTRDPYPIWLSEVMLQQTQVATVLKRFYEPFLAKFPTIEALASAKRESVMKAWEGLGYYRRAGFLHEAAKRLIIEGGLPPFTPRGVDPSRKRLAHSATHGLIERLISLPGIGKNTAHAILAFAYHQPVAILEANVKRVVARVFALETPSDAELWAGAEALLNHASPFHYNQAMMDVGALICTPKNPNCAACPARTICKGQATPAHFPAPKVKKQVPTRQVNIYVREDRLGRLYLEKRDEALLGGMYGFPQTAHQLSPVSADQPKVTESLLATNCIGSVTHTYSHFKLVGHVLHEILDAKPNSKAWHTRKAITALPLSTLDHKVLALVENCHSVIEKNPKAGTKRGKH